MKVKKTLLAMIALVTFCFMSAPFVSATEKDSEVTTQYALYSDFSTAEQTAVIKEQPKMAMNMAHEKGTFALQNSLPRTGEASHPWIVVFGIFLLLLVIVVTLLTRKKKNP